jgi:ADP-heptose:LPS heptosyltransferase
LGFGDEILSSGLARGLFAQGKRAAFGDGRRILWGPWCAEIFRGNPNIACPGSEGAVDLIWIAHFKGNRLYNKLDKTRSRWIWQYSFKAKPGEIFFDKNELDRSMIAGSGFIFVEPNVPWHKSVAPNKDWGLKNYQAVVDRLLADGYDVVQSSHGRDKLRRVRFVTTPKFRDALAVLSRAQGALVPEGGMHHGAAAVGTPAVVIFGGFIPPTVVGYDMHVNLTGGAEACGSLYKCFHCRAAMEKISVEKVYQAVKSQYDSHLRSAG